MALQFVPFDSMLNWSIDNILQSEVPYNPIYPQMTLSDLLMPDQHPVRLEDEQYYQQVTVRIGGEGIDKRAGGYKQGKAIKTKQQNRLNAGQLVLSRIDARNGAFAVVPQELEGAIVTKDFPTFRVNESLVRSGYLQLLLSSDTFSQLLTHGSKGTTNRQRVEMGYLLSQKIPVPTLAEQDELLQQYNQELDAIEENSVMAKEKEEERNRYFKDALGLSEPDQTKESQPVMTLMFVPSDTLTSWNVETALGEPRLVSSKYPVIPLSALDEALVLLKRGESPRYAEQSAVTVLNQKCVRWGYIDKEYAKPIDEGWSKRFTRESKTTEGDIMINSTGDGTIGRSAVVDADSSDMLHDSHVLLLRLNTAVVVPTYLSVVINSPYGQSQIEQLKSAKTTKQTELGVANLLKLQIPLPPLADQEEIATQMASMDREIRNLTDTKHIKATAREGFNARIFMI